MHSGMNCMIRTGCWDLRKPKLRGENKGTVAPENSAKILIWALRVAQLTLAKKNLHTVKMSSISEQNNNIKKSISKHTFSHDFSVITFFGDSRNFP